MKRIHYDTYDEWMKRWNQWKEKQTQDKNYIDTKGIKGETLE